MTSGSQTPVYIKRLEKRLDQLFDGQIDMTDWSTRSPEDQRKAFLQRAIAGYALVCLDAADPLIAAESITDGTDDNGIDALFVDANSSIVYLVQSKWCESGNRSVPQADILKFMRCRCASGTPVRWSR